MDIGKSQSLERIFKNLARSANVESDLVIVSSSEVNAWTDGNNIYLSTSLVDSLPEEQLAAVIGHEFGHIIRDHIGRSVEDLQQLRLKLYRDNSLSGVERFFSTVIIETMVTLAKQRRSRRLEHEADITGEILSRKAGYGNGRMGQALDAISNGEEHKSVLNSHPITSERIQLLNKNSGKKIKIRIVRRK